MKTVAIFENGTARLLITPETEFEKRLVGAVTNGQRHAKAEVDLRYDGHETNQRVSQVFITLQPITDNSI